MMEVQWHNSLLEKILCLWNQESETIYQHTLCNDNIKSRGAMTTIITDGGKYEVSKKVADLLRSLFIKQYESEPYHQHQNKAEQCNGVVKTYINTLMNLTGAPAHCWLLCLLYVCSLLNVTASPTLGGLTPIQALTGQVPDISHFPTFLFLGACLFQGR